MDEQTMKIEDIRITPENHSRHIGDEQPHTMAFNSKLDIHTDVHRYLDAELGGNTHDWGGKYHSWLKVFGIEPETDCGWWSKAAVHPDNLTAFVRDYNESDGGELCGRLDNLREHISMLRKSSIYIRHRWPTVIALLLAYEVHCDD